MNCTANGAVFRVVRFYGGTFGDVVAITDN
jgi:hypothetical protein